MSNSIEDRADVRFVTSVSVNTSFYPLSTELSRGGMKPRLFGAVFDLCAKYPERRLMLDQEAPGKRFDYLVGYSNRSPSTGYRVVISGKDDSLYVGELDEKGVLRIQRTGAYAYEDWFLEIDADTFSSNMTPAQWKEFRSDPLAAHLFHQFFADEVQQKIEASLTGALEAEDPSILSSVKIPVRQEIVGVRVGGSFIEGTAWDIDTSPGFQIQADFTKQERLFPYGTGWSLGYGQIFASEGRRLHEVSWLTRFVGLSGHVEVYLGFEGSTIDPLEGERYGIMARGGLFLSTGDYFPERSWKQWIPDLVIDPVALSAGAVWEEGDLGPAFEWRPTAWLRINFP